ncbi:MAG: FecR domain-containing protein [Deltaproteobacteria bacterium]|nr:FecR domain-containing protein [Deltaproteobacteria bacterium]
MIDLGRSDLPQPSLEPARLERQWSNVRERTSRREPTFAWRWPVLGAVAIAASALLVWRLVPASEDATLLAEGSAIETTHRAMRVGLEEGSAIEVAPESRVALGSTTGEDVTVSLDRGSARFDVARRPSRAFRVQTTTAGGEEVEVRVVGTAFRVSHDDDGSVSVEVERGVVEVRSGGELARLTAGGSWRSHGSTEASAEATPTDPPHPAQEALAGPSEGFVAASEGFAGPSEGFTGPSEGFTGPSEGFAGRSEVGPDQAPSRRSAHTPARTVPEARTLFEQAREARQAGSIAESARLYAQLVAEHDEDPRADVAAFELARLRMDHLDDPRGALRALDRALAGGGAFREDAMARRAVLLDRLGRDAECRTARDAYLAAFGSGVHRAAVGALCP